MKIPSALSLVVASILTTGCAGAPKSPQQSDLSHVEAITEDCQLDLSRAMAITGDNDTVVMVEGSSGKGGGAVAGGAVSGGTALAIGTLSCLATGPIYFVPCVGIVLPGATAAAERFRQVWHAHLGLSCHAFGIDFLGFGCRKSLG